MRVCPVQSDLLVSSKDEAGDLRISADIANDGQAAVRRREALNVGERRDLGGEVDAVDEDVGLFDDLSEGTACPGQSDFSSVERSTHPSWSPPYPTP